MSSESSAGAALPKGWQAFAAKPDETTAKAVAKVLQEEMNPSQADASMKLIAKTLAERSARERSKLSRLIASQLRGDIARGFVKAYARINTGHESKESMVEYFYAFGHLATSTLPGAKAPSTTPVGLDPLKLDPVKEHLAALSLIKDTDDSSIKRHRNNIVASYCAFGIQNVRPKPHMVPLLIDFFAGSTGGVTIETQRYLARELFPWLQKDPIPADPKILTALYHAALILPSWSFKPFAAQLKLDTIGDSEQARRLRALVGKTLTG
ncbi:hypothetical protein ABZT47_20625 [Sphaerisporangium sp. NPDC005289]|uniref:hypothetical protein n=1 Tax=Sphaerisporangium sp. NPDC005289 TaxID=3155247 RepID=UPI0033BC1249